MTTTYQLSDKRGDAILVVKTEHGDPQTAEQEFAAALGLAGMGTAYEGFGAAAPATVPAVQQLIHPQQPAADPWGQPPVQPMVTAPAPAQYQQPQQYAPAPAPQFPAAAAGQPPVCQHGTKVFISGTSQAGKAWKAWACPADRNDPSKCEKDWIR